MIIEKQVSTTLNDKVLKLFKRAIPSGSKVSYDLIYDACIKAGYLVHPDICQEDVLSWIESQNFNPNSTFYKAWAEIVSKDRFELFIDQILHYWSTYGTNYEGKPYIPNATPTVVDFTSFKTILPISIGEVIERCEKLLASGIALKQETVEDVLFIFSELSHTPDIEKVKNREAKMILIDKSGILPKDPVEMLRYLVYKATDSTLLIKNKDSFLKIARSESDISRHLNKYISNNGEEKMASIFLRYKMLFLAFKRIRSNRSIINRLRKLAEKHHQPKGKPWTETILSGDISVDELRKKLKTISNFKKITLLQAINVRNKKLNIQAFVIRNQKLFIKEEKATALSSGGLKYGQIIYDEIYKSLIESLKEKACKISIPTGITLTLPTSEKSFIGNYPLGTSFDLSGHDAIVGINWREEDGARDLDLSLVDIKGSKIGWNANYYNDSQSVVYSGDMTSANPEASELIYAKKGFTEGIIKVNLFNGKMNSKFKLFLAKERIVKLERNYMVDPNNIQFVIDCEMDSQEKSLAVISENKLILAHFRTGKGIVSNGHSVTNKYTEYALDTLDCYLSLSQILQDAGFKITDENPDINLNDLSKDTLIDLIS